MREMTARYRSRCKGCGQVVKVGDRILWSRETGALHNGACLDAFDGNEFGRYEAGQERRAYEAEMREERAREAEYQRGRADVAAVQALTSAGSALREALYLQMEQQWEREGVY